MWALLLSLAFGQTCAVEDAAVPGHMSVVSVTPVGKRVGGGKWLWVVPSADLAAWLASERDPSVGDLLRHLGMRRRTSEPKRLYKVVVFDVDTELMCRPLLDVDEGTEVGGVLACPSARARRTRMSDGCGRTRAQDDSGGDPLFRGRWSDLAAEGFCVLPAERFVREAGR